jgi:very-short-patch-repair endonuclease
MSGAVNHFIPVSGFAIVGFFAIVFILAAIVRTVSRPPQVRAKPLLTDRERAALAIIERTLPHARVYVQVSMGALLRSKAGLGQSETMRTRNRFSQKIVDFVIEDRASGTILALVELDDRSHDAMRDRQRDAMTASAGYRTIRLAAGRLNQGDIAARLQPLQPQPAIPAQTFPFRSGAA